MVASIIAQKYAEKNITPDYWLTDCPIGFTDACRANGAVYRFSFALVIIYSLQFISILLATKFFDQGWFAKLIIFALIVVGFYYTDAVTFNNYAWAARILAFLYLIFQQVILIDYAYTVNERCVTHATDHEENANVWFGLLLFASIVLFVGSFVAIGIMYWQFSCSDSNVIISLTLIFIVLSTLIQLFGSEQGSLLTSSIITSYATYICYSAVTLNPNQSCNPTISTNYQNVSVVSNIFEFY